MDDAPPSVAEEFAMALATALYRKGLLDAGDFADMAEGLEAQASGASPEEAERLNAAAHLAGSVVIEAEAPTESDWQAGIARSRFHVIPGGASD